MKTIRQATPDDCRLIYELAAPSWKSAYSEILTDKQMAYMLQMMYSDESLKKQMSDGHIFYIASLFRVPCGFISFHQQSDDMYVLEKLYVLPQAHGKGAGRFLVEKAEERIRCQHPDKQFLLELNVNRNNKSVEFYKRLGFHIDREVDEDIGSGFYKNDYVMRKSII